MEIRQRGYLGQLSPIPAGPQSQLAKRTQESGKEIGGGDNKANRAQRARTHALCTGDHFFRQDPWEQHQSTSRCDSNTKQEKEERVQVGMGGSCQYGAKGQRQSRSADTPSAMCHCCCWLRCTGLSLGLFRVFWGIQLGARNHHRLKEGETVLSTTRPKAYPGKQALSTTRVLLWGAAHHPPFTTRWRHIEAV